MSLELLDKPEAKEPEDGARFVVAHIEAEDPGELDSAIDESWDVYDTTCPAISGELERKRIAICPDEAAANVVAMALNLLVRAQASLGETVEASRKRRKHQGGNGKGGLRRG